MSKNSKMPIKVLIGKMGLDGHERGAKVISMGLRDEGMEVIYTGIRQSVENIVKIADEEDVDVVGISSLSGGCGETEKEGNGKCPGDLRRHYPR